MRNFPIKNSLIVHSHMSVINIIYIQILQDHIRISYEKFHKHTNTLIPNMPMIHMPENTQRRMKRNRFRDLMGE